MFENFAEDFASGLLVAEKKALARGYFCFQADDRAVFERERGLGGLGEKLAPI